MNLLLLICIASLLCAALFFLAGLLLGREQLRAALLQERQRLTVLARAESAKEVEIPPGGVKDCPPGPVLNGAVTPPGQGPAGGQLLQALVDRLRHAGRTGQVDAAAIGDQQGLLVVGSGEHDEALAAAGALLAEVAQRTRDLLPLRAVRRISVQDEHLATVVARPLSTASSELWLVTLGRGAQQETEDLHRWMEEARAVLL